MERDRPIREAENRLERFNADPNFMYCAEDMTTINGTINWWLPSCGLTGGSSGGPWVVTDDPKAYASTILSSLNSYGYSGVKKMYGPKFNSRTQAVFDAADTGVVGQGTVRELLP